MKTIRNLFLNHVANFVVNVAQICLVAGSAVVLSNSAILMKNPLRKNQIITLVSLIIVTDPMSIVFIYRFKIPQSLFLTCLKEYSS